MAQEGSADSAKINTVSKNRTLDPLMSHPQTLWLACTLIYENVMGWKLDEAIAKWRPFLSLDPIHNSKIIKTGSDGLRED